jgi:RNA polymerase sigma factor (sigma-70 family)
MNNDLDREVGSPREVEPSRAMTLEGEFDGIVAAARDGEEWALRAVYEDLAPRVAGYLRGQGVAEPDELVGEVFLQMVRELASFEGDESDLRARVLTIAHQRLLEGHRAGPRRFSISVVREPRDPDNAAVEQVEAKAVEASRGERVSTMLAGLSANQRSVVLLRALGDLSVEQVADVLDKPPRAVKRLQQRGLAFLARDGEPSARIANPVELAEARTEGEDEAAHPPEEPVPDARRLAEQSEHELTRLLGAVVDRAARLRRDSDAVIEAVEDVLASLEAAAPVTPEVRGDERPRALPRERPEPSAARITSRRRPPPPSGAGREEALLRATQMAIRGSARDEIEAMLGDQLGVANPADIVDQILGPGRA